MSNDVSYFKVEDDDTKYAFDDADGEVRIAGNTSKIGTLSNLTTTAKGNLVAAINEVDADVGTLNSKLDGSVVTANNSTNGLTARLYYLKSAPNVMCLKITGTTTVELGTASGYANLWNANTFLTNAVGERSSSIIKYVVTGGYKYQLYVEAGGLIKFGYTTRASDNTAANIPSGASVYIEELIFLK